VRHGDSSILMRHRNGFGRLLPLLGKTRKGINKRGKVRASIGKEILDTPVA
jgi:hypothetical protein